MKRTFTQLLLFVMLYSMNSFLASATETVREITLNGLVFEYTSTEACLKGGKIPANGILTIPNSIELWLANHDKKSKIPVVSIKDSAFVHCADIKEVIFPKEMTKIGIKAFYDCPNLNAIKMPEVLDEIQLLAFSKCESLEGIKLPEKLRRIGCRSFYSCHKLSQITIPESVSDIGICAFGDCTQLKSITFLSIIPPKISFDNFWTWSDDWFEDIDFENLFSETPGKIVGPDESLTPSERLVHNASILDLVGNYITPTIYSEMNESCVVYVPVGCLDNYLSTSHLNVIEHIMTEINVTSLLSTRHNIIAVYDLRGHQLSSLKLGMNIIRYANGVIKKVIKK